MTVLRTLAEIEAAGTELGRSFPPLSQEQADRVAALLAPYLTPRMTEGQANPQAA
jgi:hypothetical protein